MGLTAKETETIFQSLRGGTVPSVGLDAFAVGIERQRGEIGRMLDLAQSGDGGFKFLRGGYGCGKSFASQLAVLDAQSRRFATSFVVVSDNDLHFHKFLDVYRKVVASLGTASCPQGALGDILDRWIAKVEDSLVDAGADEDADDFDKKVAEQIEARILTLTRQAAPEDFARAVRGVFHLKQKGDLAGAGALLSWLAGSANVPASAKRVAALKGDIEGRDALLYLQGILALVKDANYQGLLIVVDEVETILRMRSDVRGKSLNGIRQICDAAKDFKGLLWLFTGTPEFFDMPKGVRGLPPLHDRVRFEKIGEAASLRQPQLELKPFDAARLKEVALKLREIYPAKDRPRMERLVSVPFIEQLVASVTQGFAGNVGVVPRQFLRRFVTILDLVQDEGDFDPAAALKFEPTKPLEPAEERARAKKPPYDPEPGEEKGYEVESVMEF